MGMLGRLRRRIRGTGGEPELLTGKPGDIRKCPRDGVVLNVVYLVGDEGGDRVGMICPRCGRLYEERANIFSREDPA